MTHHNGAQHICRVLESRDVKHVFGLPGSQNAVFFSELRRSTVEPVVTTNEMSAGFAALGYAITTQRSAIMAIIGGPGFTYALTPLHEANLDCVPLVCIVFVRSGDKTKSFRLQQTDYSSIADSVCKSVLAVSDLAAFATTLDQAISEAENGAPGPVLVVVESTLLEQPFNPNHKSIHKPPTATASRHRPPLPSAMPAELQRLLNGQRVLLYLGRGASRANAEVAELAEKLDAAILTTTSGRGVVDERNPRVLRSDLVPVALVNEFIQGFDRVLALGVRFSENGSRGFGIRFNEQQLIHVDADPESLNANYSALFTVHADVKTVVDALLDSSVESAHSDSEKLNHWSQRFVDALDTYAEPRFQGLTTPTASGFFSELQQLMPDTSVLVTDSGTHQMLCRRHWIVRAVHGLIVPTNFQSMGFAIPVAMGVALAQPSRKVAAIVGDGGFQMSGLQLLAAASRNLSLTTFVFNDGFFGHIRNQQLQYDGQEAGTVLPEFDLAAFSDAIGARYFDGSTDLVAAGKAAIAMNGLSIVEVLLNDATVIRRTRTKATIKRMVQNSPFAACVSLLRRLLQQK